MSHERKTGNIRESQPELQNDEQLIHAYLLGDLSQEDSDMVEKRYFADPAFLEQINLVEAEILEDYVLDNLSAEQKVKIERNLLNSEYQRTKLKFAQVLVDMFPGHSANT